MSLERFDCFSIEDHRLKQIKESERKKTLELLEDMRTRLQQEKASELERQKEILLKNFEAELQRILHQKEEELKKTRAETKKIKEHLTLQVRDAERRVIQSSPIANEGFNRKLATEVVELKGVKRRLEEALGDALESDKRKANELRKLHEEHVAELGHMKKEAEGDIRKLLAELKAKDRVIKQLKRELCILRERSDFWIKHQCKHKKQDVRSDDDEKNLSSNGLSSDNSKISVNICKSNKKNSNKRKYVSNSNENSDVDEKYIDGVTNVKRKERKILKTSQVPEIMYKRLYKEHLELQRSFALLRQLVSEKKGEQVNNKNIINLTDENQKLGHIALHLKNKIQKLRRELKESHDQNELLEFCVLEMENQGKSVPKLIDCGVNTERSEIYSTQKKTEFDSLVTSYPQSYPSEEFNEKQVLELKKSLKDLYYTQDSSSYQHVLIKATFWIQNNYYTMCSLQNTINSLKEQLEETKKEKEKQSCHNSELLQTYEQSKKNLEETKNQLTDVSQKLMTVQKRESCLYHLEQINLKFKEHLQIILQDFHVLLSSPDTNESNIQILKDKINALYEIEKELISQAQKTGTLQASQNPLLSEIGEEIICKFATSEKINTLHNNNEFKTSDDNEDEIQKLHLKLQKQDLLIENYVRQQKELCNNYNELSSKVTEYESVKYDLTQKINTLEKSEQDLVEKNLKLYIDYVSAKEEVQKLLFELESRQEFLSSNSSHEVQNTSIQCSEIERTLSEESDPLGTMTSEDEGLGEERRGDSTGPSSLADLQESEEDLLNRTSDFESENVDDHKLNLEISQNGLLEMGLRKEFMEENQKMKLEWKKEIEKLREREKELVKQLNCSQTLISKLHENIKVKEEQVRKLLQENTTNSHDNCQEQELKSKITHLQKDLLNLQERLTLSEENKNSLKEQLLELEEAENDARLVGQKLQEKLILSIKKENQLQSELEKYKNPFSESFNQIKYQHMTENELHSQIAYMEILIQKYEDQIQTLETSKLNLKQRVYYLEQLLKSAEALTNTLDSDTGSNDIEKFRPPNQFTNFELCEKNILSTYENFPLDNNTNKYFHVSSIPFNNVSTQTDFNPTNICIFCNSFIINTNSSVLSENSISVQQELLQRLLVLEKEDQTLREQLHQMDGMNLALWKKLHNLESHVGKCMKEYVTDVNSDENFITNKNSVALLQLDENNLNFNVNELNSDDYKEQLHLPSDINSDKHILERILSLENNEQKLKDRLLQLECINHEFEKELEVREKLYKEREIQHQKWLEIENTFQETIRNLENEKTCLLNKVLGLEEEKLQLHKSLSNLQLELEILKNNHDQSLKELEFNHQQTLNQLNEKQQNFGTLEAEQIQRMTELEHEQKSIGLVSKTFEINFKKYNLITSELELLKKDHLILKENAKKNKEEIVTITKDFEHQFDILKNLQKKEEEKLKLEIDHLLTKEKEYNSQIIKMIEKQTLLEHELINKESELEKTKKEFQNEMKMLEEEHHIIEAELKWKLKEMEENAAVTVKALKEERKRLENDLQADLEDLHTKEQAYKLRITELETFVEQLRNEVNRITDANGSKCDDEKLGIQSESELLLQKIDAFQKNEKKLKDKLIDMEKKEEAYKETLEHAEKIIATLEKDYSEKIEELELSERSLKLRVCQLEEIENCLRCTLHNEKRTSELRKSSDLIEELMESEMREAALREQINELESNQRTLLQKLQELDKNRKYLQEELSDHEEMVYTIEKLKQEIEFLKRELLSVQNSENALQESLQQADEILIQREDDLKQNLMQVEEEKKGLEETISQLRKQVKELESLLEKSQFEKLLPFGEQLYETVVNSGIEEEFLQQDESIQNSLSEISNTQEIQELEKNGNELRQEISYLRQSLSTTSAHLTEVENINRNQNLILSELEKENLQLKKQLKDLEKIEIRYSELEYKYHQNIEEKSSFQQQLNKLQEEQKWWESLRETNSQLQKQVSMLQDQLTYMQFKRLGLESDLDGKQSLDKEIKIEFQNEIVIDKIKENSRNDDFIKNNCNSETEFKNNREMKVESLAYLCQKVLKILSNSTRNVDVSEETENYVKEMKENSQSNLRFNKTDSINNYCKLEAENFSPTTWSAVPGTVSLEDLTTGLEAKLQLEQCVLRAVAAMERDMQLKEASKTISSDISSDNVSFTNKITSMATTDFIPKSEILPIETENHQQQFINPFPPSDFCILRQIGNHSLLVGWKMPKEGSQIGGYQIYVEGQLHQKVRSAEHTKALLTKLNVSKPLTISIYSISTLGHTSEPAFVFHPGCSQEFLRKENNRPVMCKTEHSCVLRIYAEDNECQEISVQKGSCVLVTSVPDDDGFCTVQIEDKEGKLPVSVLKEVENHCFDEQ